MHPERVAARARFVLLGLGIGLCATSVLLAIVARRLAETGPGDVVATATLIALLMVSGFALLNLLWIVPRASRTPRLVHVCLGMGLLMRLAQFGSPTLHERDYERYLWDGAVTAAGLDPYALPPAAAAAQRVTRSVYRQLDAPDAAKNLWPLADLADISGPTIERVPYPYLTTIYPPVAQAMFYLAHTISPFSLDAWRLVLLIAELATAALLLHLLTLAGQPRLWVLLYWWNPLLIAHVANAAHMDVLLCPVLLASLWALVTSRGFLASALLAIAIGIKLWPALLIPAVAAGGRGAWKIAGAAALCIALSGLLLWPQMRHLAEPGSGLIEYTVDWQRNAFAFPLLVRVLEPLPDLILGPANLARVLVALFIGGMALRLARSPADPSERARHWLVLIAALFLLSPTGYPWYYVWFLPLLCLWRHPALLTLTALLPLYYARFPLELSGQRELFQTWIVGLEFLPVWLMLAVFAMRART